jgi:hypothetical protein
MNAFDPCPVRTTSLRDDAGQVRMLTPDQRIGADRARHYGWASRVKARRNHVTDSLSEVRSDGAICSGSGFFEFGVIEPNVATPRAMVDIDGSQANDLGGSFATRARDCGETGYDLVRHL